MPKKIVFPLCDEIEPTTKKLFLEYKDSTDFSKGYYERLERLLLFIKFQNRKVKTFSLSDIEEMITTMWENGYKIKTTNAYLGSLSGFRQFLIDNHSFPKDFLDGITNYYVKDETPSESIEFSLLQLKSIRTFNLSKPEFEYIFEIFFQLGIDKKDLSLCLPKYRNKTEKRFEKGEKKINYNSKISHLLEGDLDFSEIEKISRHVDYFYFRHLTEYGIREGIFPVGNTITYSDIKKSHDIYIIRCPNPECRELTENIHKNWVLVLSENDQDYRLCCTTCKGKGLI